MILMQLSASQGPLECALAVAKALEQLQREANADGVRLELVEHLTGARKGTYLSATVTLEGTQAAALARRWAGTVQWICASPFRPGHARKNWFIGVAVYDEPPPAQIGEIRFEACRASGPGGQHVNKTDSAIRATHSASGISVKVQSQRSQHANKRLATLLIEQKLAEQADKAAGALRAERRIFHHGVERGNPVRVFRGERFLPDDAAPA
ncbi:peptide chain release factor H [Niveibacterium sp. 24ML]|uniref:peptide chain release factor H n=1 Tax=Niveibacterium sp. 24ML TaxID=2985512 RepID=UPI00226E7D54|nr:peptide chain release factor H [Niveibacterium sp. 24ML]